MNLRPALFGVVLLLASSCAKQADDGPPTIAYGRDECAHCGMLVSDERFAAASRAIIDGQQTTLAFDDIGDLFAWEKKHPQTRIVSRWVHDVQTRAWINAENATFVRDDEQQTPMSSGLMAFSDRPRAESRTKERGQLVGLGELMGAP